MKCPKCGREIANDSVFCGYCGARVDQQVTNMGANQTMHMAGNQSAKNWLKPVLFVCGGVVAVIVILVVVLLLNGNKESAMMTDAQQMNLKGNVSRIKEISYYTCEEWDKSDARNERGGIFDDAAFLSIVYGGEHLAYNYIQNFFFQNVSDCEMSFNEDGNIRELTSINPGQEHILFYYDGQKLLQQIDAASTDPQFDYDEVTDFTYSYLDGNVKSAQMCSYQKSGEGERTNINMEFEYKDGQIERATYQTQYGNATIEYNNENGRIESFFFPQYDHGQDLKINITYNANNDISGVRQSKGAYGTATTSFRYEFDANGNWTTRYAEGVIEYMQQEGSNTIQKSTPFSIRTVREIEYR